jgi:hypothetical protein
MTNHEEDYKRLQLLIRDATPFAEKLGITPIHLIDQINGLGGERLKRMESEASANAAARKQELADAISKNQQKHAEAVQRLRQSYAALQKAVQIPDPPEQAKYWLERVKSELLRLGEQV